jgi:hypothetical protein
MVCKMTMQFTNDLELTRIICIGIRYTQCSNTFTWFGLWFSKKEASYRQSSRLFKIEIVLYTKSWDLDHCIWEMRRACVKWRCNIRYLCVLLFFCIICYVLELNINNRKGITVSQWEVGVGNCVNVMQFQELNEIIIWFFKLPGSWNPESSSFYCAF